MSRAARIASLLGVAALGACGGSEAPGPGLAAWRSFDVTAALTVTPTAGDEGSWTTFPKAATFTAAWSETTGVVVTGGQGAFGNGLLTLAADGTFQSGGWVAGVPFADGCGGLGTVFLDHETFSVSGGALVGTATGRAQYITSGATTMETGLTATLSGVADATAPVLGPPGMNLDPLAELLLVASEPLPSPMGLSLVGAPGGDRVAAQTDVFQEVESAAVGFSVPAAVLSYAETYTAEAGVTDLAGHALVPLTFTTRPLPPLVPEDGFESLTGTTFAGAGVLQGGPLPPISGTTSLLLNTGFGGGFGFLPYDLGPSVAVRLAVSPGDTVVRFAMRLIAPDIVDAAAYDGVIRLGQPGGGAVVESHDLGATQFTRTTLPSLGDVFLSPVRTVEVPLPAGAAGPITFEIIGRTFSCDRPPSPTVLVIDDLRVE